VPFKHHAARRHHIGRQKWRVVNTRAYNEALRQRGSLTVWISDEAIAGWPAGRRTDRGGQPIYSDMAILTALMVWAAFKLGLRQAQGLVRSVFALLEIDLPVPDYSTLSRRSRTMRVPEFRPGSAEPLHLLIDSTGLKLGGAGEWLIEKHGSTRRRSWRKLHFAFDRESGEIVAAELSRKEVDDGDQAVAMLGRIAAPIASFTGDGGYDQDKIYQAVEQHDPSAAVIVPPRAGAVLSETHASAPTQRDSHILAITEHGRMTWQKQSRYNLRARAEAGIGRFKRVIGDGLRSRTPGSGGDRNHHRGNRPQQNARPRPPALRPHRLNEQTRGGCASSLYSMQHAARSRCRPSRRSSAAASTTAASRQQWPSLTKR
jgi:Transposase DDE domain